MGKRSSGSKEDRQSKPQNRSIVRATAVWEWVLEHEDSVAANIMLHALNAGTLEASLPDLVQNNGGNRGVVLRALRLLEKRAWISVVRQTDGQALTIRSLAISAELAHELN